MEPANETKARRPRRSKADIQEAINKAAIAQIKKKGFALALVTDIVKRAKIEPIVFYNRYKNLDEFYSEFVKRYEFWPGDLISDYVGKIDSGESYSNLLEKLMTNLMSDDIMVELLRWEIAEGNHITERTSRLREIRAIELNNNRASLPISDNIDITAITALIVAGIYYLVLHKDRSTFVGIDINTIPGKRRVLKAIRAISAMMFEADENNRLNLANADEETLTYRRNYEAACRERVESDYRDHVEDLIRAKILADRQRIAKRMRSEGIPDEIIDLCVNEQPEK